MSQLKVLIVAAELTPLAKVGGLADVVGALPKALHKLGIDVRIVIPKYGIINEKKYPLKKVIEDIGVPFNNNNEIIDIYETALPSSEVPIYLIDNFRYLGKNGVYFETAGPADNPHREAERFTFFARSSLAIFDPLEWYPDIVHCQDWHAGMIPVLLKVLAKNDQKLEKIKTLSTIHNLEYQGWYKTKIILNALDLTVNDYHSLAKQKDGHISSLRQAILASDHLNTVSPNYGQEILTPEYGAGLEPDLQSRKKELVGILNGIDVERFDPATDPDIIVNYTPNNLSGKAKCKESLQEICRLEVNPDVPILGIVTRLANQKGISLISEVADDLAKENMQFVLLGTGERKLENMIKDVTKKYPEKFYAKIDFNAGFAQQIYAGSDMFLMPSRFEPCGLGQMIAMRYGTVPIVRSTGGLKDTVADYNEKNDQGDGFSFEELKSSAFLEAIKRALSLYKDQKKWYNLITRIMQKDFSWNVSAKKYIELYKKLAK